MTASIRVAFEFPAVLVLLALTGPGHAACLDDDRVAELVAGYPTTPVTGIPPDLSLDDAYCTQAKYTTLLERSMGAPVGYKVGFTGEALQELWLVEEMKRRGTPLWPGDRLILGATGKLFPLKDAGKMYTYTLKGLPGGPTSVSVTIE